MLSLYAGMQPIAYLLARDTPGIGKWASGNFLSALGGLLVLVRPYLPPSATVVAANAAILAGFCLMLARVRRSSGRPSLPALPFVLLLGFHLMLLLHFTYIREDVAARTLFYCLFMGAFTSDRQGGHAFPQG